MKKLIKRIKESIIVETLIQISRNIMLDRKQGLSLYYIGLFVGREFKENNVNAESKAVAYNFTLAVFPAIIFLFTLIPYLTQYLPTVNGQPYDIMEFFRENTPKTLFPFVESTITDIVSNKHDGLLSFGAVLALFMSTNGMMSLIGAFNRCYRTAETRNVIVARLIALALNLVLIVVMVVGMVAIVFGNSIIEALKDHFAFAEDVMSWLHLADGLRFGVFFLLYFIGISLIYYLAPSVQKRWKFFSHGSFIASVMSVLVSLAFSYYIDNFATYNKVYGSIGALIAFMIWIQWMSLTLLVGFEINAGIDRARRVLRKTRKIVDQK